MADWPEPNERGKIECADCHGEWPNPVAYMYHDCFPIPVEFHAEPGDKWMRVERNDFVNVSAWERFIHALGTSRCEAAR